MNKTLRSLLAIMFVLPLSVLTSCGGGIDSLVGTYSVEEGGQLNEIIRIQKRGETYLMSEKQNGQWLAPFVVTPVTKSDFEKMAGEAVNIDFDGLGNDSVAVFRVPKGWKLGRLGECKTGYFLAGIFPVELHKE